MRPTVISSPEELYQFTLMLFSNKTKPLTDERTFESIADCLRQFISQKTLPMQTALQILHHLLYANIRCSSIDICKYCCEMTESFGDETGYSLFHDILAILSDSTSDRVAAIKALYRLKSVRYEAFAYLGEPELKLILHALRLSKIHDALDIGCGAGRVGQLLRGYGYANQLTGIDLSPHMLAIARDSGAYTDLIEGDIVECVGAYHDRFDLITMVWVSAHCSKPALAEIMTAAAGALKAGGTFIFDINADLRVEDRNNAVGTIAHATDDIIGTARPLGLAIRYLNRDGRIFFRLTKRA